MIETFQNSLFSTAPVILGRKLKPFSLAHKFAIRTLDNPIFKGSDWTRADLLTAVWICRLTHSEINKKVFDASSYPELSAWSELLADEPDVIWDEAFSSFQSYVVQFSEMPEHWQTGNEKPLLHPSEFILVVELCKNRICQCAEDAWNMPVNMANAYYSAIGETMGDDSLVVDIENQKCLSVGDLIGRFGNG